MDVVISGIQQIGIGVSDVNAAWDWYRRNLGYDLKIFEEAADAEFMLPYPQGEVRSRHAILAYNIQGGGGLEIWQYTSRTPVGPDFKPGLGDLGIFGMKIRAYDVPKLHADFKAKSFDVLSEVQKDPSGRKFFFMNDPWGNLIQILEDSYKFKDAKLPTGGNMGCLIGTNDIEASLTLYRDVLGYDEVVYDEKGVFEDFANIEGGSKSCRRVRVRHSKDREGFLSGIFGPSEMEFIQLDDQSGKKIFEGRDWGDLGYIHLCFDIRGMQELKTLCANHNYPFTVESNPDFDMGEAAGQFAYIEAKEGTLIEFVETHKIPMLKSIGWYLNLHKRDPRQPMPAWFYMVLNLVRKKV